MGRHLVALALLAIFAPANAFADWYILLPKKPLPKREVTKLPKLKVAPKKVKPKPYSVEVKKIIAPAFSVPLFGEGKLCSRELLGKTVVIFFVDGLFTPFTERLVSALERLNLKGTTFIVVSVNDADFAQVYQFKRLMGVKRVVVSADSYVYKLFKERVKNLSVPSVVVIDKYGFIRFFSPNLEKVPLERATAQLQEIVRSLQEV